MKSILTIIVLLASTYAYADESCDVDLQGGLRITNAALEFEQGDHVVYKIVNDKTLWVNGSNVQLSEPQQQMVRQYATNIRALVPEVRQLSLDSVDLATNAVDIIFKEFLASDDQSAKKIHSQFLVLKKDLEKKFSSDEPIYIHQSEVVHTNGTSTPGEIKNKTFIDKNFEDSIGKMIESVGTEIGWAAMKTAAFAIFSSINENEFDERMKRMGEKVDREMGARGKQLEARSNTLCKSIAALDIQEEGLKTSIKAIAPFNFITLPKPNITIAAEH